MQQWPQLLREKANGHHTPGEQYELHILRRTLKSVSRYMALGLPDLTGELKNKTKNHIPKNHTKNQTKTKPTNDQHAVLKSHEETHHAFPFTAAYSIG